MTTISLSPNPWTLPSGSVYLEGVPSEAELEQDRQEARAARAAWAPSDQAWALLERLRSAIGHDVIVQARDLMTFWSDDEGPYPLAALCADVTTREDDGGKMQAYLVLEHVEIIKTPHGYDPRSNLLREENGRYLVNVGALVELDVQNRRGRGKSRVRSTRKRET